MGGRSTDPKGIIKVTKEEDTIVLNISNEIGKNVTKGKAKKRIRDIKKAMREERYSQSIITEGGTGFHKIRKILLHDFKSPRASVKPEMDFGFCDSRHFSVELRIPIIEYSSMEEISS